MTSRNTIQTWQQGQFVYQEKYRYWTQEQKNLAWLEEERRVRPAPKENAICVCTFAEDSQWIASRLNLAAKLEILLNDLSEKRIIPNEFIRAIKRAAMETP